MIRLSFVSATLLALSGCGEPTHLQYDHGRAFQAALTAQADLSRPSAAHAAYPLSGEEGVALRREVLKESSNAETTDQDAIK